MQDVEALKRTIQGDVDRPRNQRTSHARSPTPKPAPIQPGGGQPFAGGDRSDTPGRFDTVFRTHPVNQGDSSRSARLTAPANEAGGS